MNFLFTHLPTTAYPPGTMGVTASPEFTPSGNHVAMASPTSRPNAAPEDEKKRCRCVRGPFHMSKDFIKGQVPGKLTSYEDDFVHLVCSSTGNFPITKFSSKRFASL